MAARDCGFVGRESENQPADASLFFLKDINPRKPNRWLCLAALPHALRSRNDAGGPLRALERRD